MKILYKTFISTFFILAVFIFSGCDGGLLVDSKNVWDKDGLSFEYPVNMTITGDDFSPYGDIDIFVKTTTIDGFIEDCVVNPYGDYGVSEDVLRNNYTRILKMLQEKGVNREIESFDNLTCNATKGNVYSEQVDINGNNAVLLHSVLANEAGGLTVFYTQLYFVDEHDYVHSVVFSYDFGDLADHLDSYRNEYGTVYIGGDYDKAAKEWNKIVDYFAYGTEIEDENFKLFEKNQGIIRDIISTFKFDVSKSIKSEMPFAAYPLNEKGEDDFVEYKEKLLNGDPLYGNIKYREDDVDLNDSVFEYLDTSKSSFVEGAWYDEVNDYMVIGLNGIKYHYCGLPYLIWDDFKDASSFGSYYYYNIKGEYDCREGYVPAY